MNKRKLTINGIAALVFGVMTASVQAAPMVTFHMAWQDDGTFSLFGSSSQGDNAGIATYGVPLTGPILTIDHQSPNAAGQGALGNQTVALGLIRTVDDLVGPAGPITLSASQDTFTPGYVVYGLGQTSGDLVIDATGGLTAIAFPEQQSYDAKLLIATGTYDNTSLDKPGIDVSSLDLIANVFVSNNGFGTTAADINTLVTPEPASVVMFAIGVVLTSLPRRINMRR